MAQDKLLKFDPAGAFLPNGLDEAECRKLDEQLLTLRDEIFNVDLDLFQAGGPIPTDKQPLDTAFVDLPDRLLKEYEDDRINSIVGQVISTAKRVRETVDRVVVIGIGGSYMGARALMDACCEPYYNELSRAERAGRPRMYFAGCNVDNDSTQGLLHLLRTQQDDFSKNWAIVVISKSGGTLEPAAALRQFLRELESTAGSDALPELVVPVTGETGKLSNLATEVGCRDRFIVPDGVGGRFSVLSPVGLLPAAILGLDIVKLLKGAWLMNGHFQSAAPADNVVLNYVAVNHLMEKRGYDLRLLSVWNDALETVGWWHDQLLAESIGKQELGVTPLTVLNTRDLHSRAQQHQEGKHDKIINNLVVDQWRCDPLTVGQRDSDPDQLNELGDKALPDLMSAAIQGTNEAYWDDRRPTTTISLPIADEHSLGQLFQMLMLATVVECRLVGVNPYGQPGVEKYKINMNRILREGSAKTETSSSAGGN